MSHFVFSYVVFVWKSNGIIHIAALGILQMHNFCNLSKFSNLKHAFSFIFFSKQETSLPTTEITLFRVTQSETNRSFFVVWQLSRR